jgi:sugar phosphate isomerase/epimerase
VSIVKIGIQTRGLRQPLKQALRTAARLGADGVEIDARHELRPGEISRTGMREFHKLIGDLSLRVSAVAFPTRRGYDVPDELERRVFATQTAMQFAVELGTDVVVNRVGQIAPNAEDSSFKTLVEALTALGAYGERIGARLAAQTAADSPQQVARLLAALPQQTIGIDLHPGQLILAGHSLQDALDALGRHVIHVHASDAVPEAGGRGRQVELGRGTADLPEVLGHLAEYDYRGWVTIESRDSADPITETENAVAYLRALG